MAFALRRLVLRRTGLLVLVALISTIPVDTNRAAILKYTPMRLTDMAARADLIVVGEIVGVDGTENFQLRISEVLHGDAKACGAKDEHLTVRQFQNWTCASRWTDYAPGQHVALFLVREKERLAGEEDGEGGFRNRILSAGGEGEMPIEMTEPASEKGKPVPTTVRARGRSTLPGMSVDYEPGRPRGSDVPYKDFVEAIRTFRGKYSFKTGKGSSSSRPKGEWNGTDEELKEFRKSNDLARALVDGVAG